MVSKGERDDALGDVLQTARDLQDVFLAKGWQFCIIGGLAVQRWGEPRVTRDVDVTLLTGFDEEERYVTHLLSLYAPRRPDAAEFALKQRVLLLQSRGGIGLDIALG